MSKALNLEESFAILKYVESLGHSLAESACSLWGSFPFRQGEQGGSHESQSQRETNKRTATPRVGQLVFPERPDGSAAVQKVRYCIATIGDISTRLYDTTRKLL